MKIQSNKMASKRTKNRINQHGPDFSIEDKMSVDSLGCFCFLLRSAKTGWLGWIPEVEITVIPD